MKSMHALASCLLARLIKGTGWNLYSGVSIFIAIGFECMGIKSCPLVTSLPFPSAGGSWEPHISVQRREDPRVWGQQRLAWDSAAWLQQAEIVQQNNKSLICPNFSAGKQSFHYQEKLPKPGLEILAEAGGRARSPDGTWPVMVGTPSPPQPTSKAHCFDLLT